MCKVLKVSRSGYHKWLKSEPSKRAVENKKITQSIRQIHRRSKQTYGSPRIQEVLETQGIKVSRQRVARLMVQAGIRSKIKKKFVATTDSKHDHPVADNLLDRNFEPGGSQQVWISDLTYIQTAEGWLFLTVILDLACRKVIGWALSQSLEAEQTSVAAWKMAVKQQQPRPGLIFHSDRGVQYACSEFRGLLSSHQAIQSMSRRANCWDNAVAESFFKSLKVEWLYDQRFATRKQAQLAVFEYIETWYNTQRLHSALGYMPPAEFEQLLLNSKLVQ